MGDVGYFYVSPDKKKVFMSADVVFSLKISVKTIKKGLRCS